MYRSFVFVVRVAPNKLHLPALFVNVHQAKAADKAGGDVRGMLAILRSAYYLMLRSMG